MRSAPARWTGVWRSRVTLLEETDGAGIEIADGADQLHVTDREPGLRLVRCDDLPDRMSYVGLHRRIEQCPGCLGSIEFIESREDTVEQHLDAALLFGAPELPLDGGLDCAAACVAHDDEKRRLKVRRCVLQRAQDRRPEHIACDADDKELAERRIEDKFGRHAAVAAAQDRRIGLLPFGKVGKDLLLHRWKSRPPADEALIARLEAAERLVRCMGRSGIRGHGRTPKYPRTAMVRRTPEGALDSRGEVCSHEIRVLHIGS